MTSPKITVQSRNGNLRPRIQHGWFDVDGLEALIIILIIVAARIVRRSVIIIARAAARLVKIISPPAGKLIMRVTRWSLRHSAGVILAFRAFYLQ